MRRYFAPLCATIAVTLLMSLPLPSWSGWGPSGCTIAAQAPVGVIQPPATYKWVNNTETPDQVNLYLGDKQVGAWDTVSRRYMAIDGERWVLQACPIAPPNSSVMASWQTSGVKADKINGTHEIHQLSGQEVPKGVAFAQIGTGNELTDDSAKLFILPLTKDPVLKKKFSDDYNADPALADLRSRAILWDGPASDPDHFLMKDRNGKSLYAHRDGFTLCMLDPTGGVLFRKEGYAGQVDLQKLRQADPKYDPRSDPTPARPSPSAFDITKVPPFIWVFLVAAVVLGIILLNTRKRS